MRAFLIMVSSVLAAAAPPGRPAPPPAAAPPARSADAPATPPAPAAPPASVVGGSPLKLPDGEGGSTVLQGQPMAPAAPALDAGAPTGGPESAAAAPPLPAPESLSPALAVAVAADLQRREVLRELTRRLFPEPITEADLDWWAVSLGLGPDSVAFARELRVRYENKVRPALAPEAGALVMASYDWSEDGARLVPRWTPVHVSMVVRRAQLVTALRDAEAQLARDLVAIVPPERQRDARRLFFRRQFDVGSPGATNTLAGLDVVSLVEELRLPEAEMAVVSPLLDAYVADLGPTMRSRTFSALDRDVREAQLLSALGPMWQAVVSDEDRPSIEEELAALRAADEAASAPLRRLNRSTLAALASQLPSRSAALLLDRLWLRVHPTQFEDERGLARLVMEAIEHPSASPSEREGRLNFVAALRTRLLPLGLDLAEIADLTDGVPMGAVAGDAGSRSAALGRLEREVARLEALGERRTICINAAHGLESMLNSTEAALIERCRAFRQALEMQNSADSWMLRRCRGRVAEIQAREAEEALAAENAEPNRDADRPTADERDGDVAAPPPRRPAPPQAPARPAGARPGAPLPPRTDARSGPGGRAVAGLLSAPDAEDRR